LTEFAQASRTDPRLHFAGSGLILFGLSDNQLTGAAGLQADLGVVFSDHVALFAHGEIATAVITFYGSAGLGVSYAFTEHFMAGLGANVTAWSSFSFSTNFTGFTFPLRLRWLFSDRKPDDVRRRGLYLGLDISAGVNLIAMYPYDTLSGAFAASVSVGYALW
jgi:hypothetical protein